ncbi:MULTISPECIES: transaldolase [unclassified Luteococcus]|uniref:transaldolase n=1 Tax=unclassified Luteococcus TaxID=2639923 RepID=UPI00313BCCA6
MNDRLNQLADAGVSIWLDDLSRERLTSGNLASLIAEKSVTGVTTNPTIFAVALSDGQAYSGQVSQLVAAGTTDVDDVIRALTTTDVRDACDLFTQIHEETDGVDGRVSIEVEPGLAMDPDATVEQAQQLHALVDRPNLLVKIPATEPGLAAIRRTIAAGISVNVTLIFSIERYRAVLDAWLGGLEDALAAGRDIDEIHSVASFFVSRVDTEVDKRLTEIGTDEALALRGQAALANARIAYAAWLEVMTSPRWGVLKARGAHPQRPLWASTGVKNPDYEDTMYVTQLVADGCVNTMPEKTLDAVADHGEITGDTISDQIDDAIDVMGKLTEVGVDLDDVVAQLETEGVSKFNASWAELVGSVGSALQGSKP